MRLVDDWKRAWRWFSMQAMASAGAVQVGWVSLPDDMRRSIPASWVSALTMLLLVAGIAGRLVKQNPAPGVPPQDIVP